MPFVAERNLWPFLPQIKNTLQTLSSARCQFQFTHIRTHTLTQTPKDTRSYYLWPIAVHISWHVLGNFFPRMLCSKLPPIKFISLKSFHLIFIDSVAPQTHTHTHMSALKHTYARTQTDTARDFHIGCTTLCFFECLLLICPFITYTLPIRKCHVASFLLN